MDQTAPFCLLLLGQPTLRRRLRLGAYAALDQRVGLRYAISGLDQTETASYIAHHLKLAGRSDTLFSDDAVELIHRSQGACRARSTTSPPSRWSQRSPPAARRSSTSPPPAPRSLRSAPSERPAGADTADDAAHHDQPHELLLATPADWPAAPEPAAYHGLAGDIIAALEPHTEADPVAILAQLLVAFGAAVGRGAHYTVEATRHHPNEFLVLVGDSAKARKGSSWDHVARVLAQADPSLSARTLTGLSSGEGLIWTVRDQRQRPRPRRPAAAGDRAEFASVLKHTTRDINTLSPVLRSAWDARPLALMTRTAPARATQAHVA